jgi:arylsulfatase A-like enzyme
VLPALLGESATGRDYVLEHAGQVAIREGQWKFIPGTDAGGAKKAAGKRSPQGGLALYDLAQDPAESENVASQHPELVERLSRRLEELRAQEKGRP